MATASPAGPQIFICYDKTYQERALELHARLANDLQGKLSRDVVVFIDRENLASGDAWDARIREALAQARLMIVLLNDGLVTRPYCRFEVETFLARIKAGERCHILPVRWQRDSEIYRTGAIATASADALDRAYLGSLPAEAAALVTALREIQFLDGAALREDTVGSESFNAAFRHLSAEATRLYRLAQRDQAAPAAPPPAETPAPAVPAGAAPGRSRLLVAGIAAFVVVAGVAGWLASRAPSEVPPPVEPPSAERPTPGVTPPGRSSRSSRSSRSRPPPNGPPWNRRSRTARAVPSSRAASPGRMRPNWRRSAPARCGRPSASPAR
jgi:hypothetical protein